MTRNARRAPGLIFAITLAGALSACGGSGAAHHARGKGAAASATLLRGTVASVSPGDLVLRTGTGSVTVKLTPPLQVYHRAPATLADVKNGVFIGVTTVKQPDGSEQATEIHIFPEALRGLGEGSHMMTQSPGGGSRMTNGAVSGPRMTNGAVAGSPAASGAMAGSRMTNGAVSGSRMSRGNVAGARGSLLVVQYAGGALKVVVPPNTQITRIDQTSSSLAPGDQVVVPATRGADGSLSTDKALLSGR